MVNLEATPIATTTSSDLVKEPIPTDKTPMVKEPTPTDKIPMDKEPTPMVEATPTDKTPIPMVEAIPTDKTPTTVEALAPTPTTVTMSLTELATTITITTETTITTAIVEALAPTTTETPTTETPTTITITIVTAEVPTTITIVTVEVPTTITIVTAEVPTITTATVEALAPTPTTDLVLVPHLLVLLVQVPLTDLVLVPHLLELLVQLPPTDHVLLVLPETDQTLTEQVEHQAPALDVLHHLTQFLVLPHVLLLRSTFLAHHQHLLAQLSAHPLAFLAFQSLVLLLLTAQSSNDQQFPTAHRTFHTVHPSLLEDTVHLTVDLEDLADSVEAVATTPLLETLTQ
jgi:hypothetical protein